MERRESDRSAYPSVTFFVMSYNQERFIEHAVSAALGQDYPSLEIVLSDDCSTDGSFSIMRQMASEYRGPHRVVLNRNPGNLGIGAHVNRIMELATGELIIASAGDDVSFPNRTSRVVSEWTSRRREPDCISSMVITMSSSGIDLGLNEFRTHNRWDDQAYVVRHGGYTLGAANAWTRRLWSTFGPMSPLVINEDVVVPLRASLMGGVCFIYEPLIRYRYGVGALRTSEDGRSPRPARRALLHKFFDREVHTSAQALSDVRLLGNPLLMALAETRLRESEILRDLCRGSWLSPMSLAKEFGRGVSLQRIASATIRAWLPIPNWLVIGVRRIIGRSEMWSSP
jgi:glycosyltransferase involved in cell wall biosynthesis